MTMDSSTFCITWSCPRPWPSVISWAAPAEAIPQSPHWWPHAWYSARRPEGFDSWPCWSSHTETQQKPIQNPAGNGKRLCHLLDLLGSSSSAYVGVMLCALRRISLATFKLLQRSSKGFCLGWNPPTIILQVHLNQIWFLQEMSWPVPATTALRRWVAEGCRHSLVSLAARSPPIPVSCSKNQRIPMDTQRPQTYFFHFFFWVNMITHEILVSQFQSWETHAIYAIYIHIIY